MDSEPHGFVTHSFARLPWGERRSLRDISAELAEMGHLGSTGRPFSPSIIKAMVEGPL